MTKSPRSRPDWQTMFAWGVFWICIVTGSIYFAKINNRDFWDMKKWNSSGKTILYKRREPSKGKIIEFHSGLFKNEDPAQPKNALNAELFKAVRDRNLKKIKELIEGGANINARSAYLTTPLMEASAVGYEEVVAFLLQNGANTGLKSAKGETALSLAKDNERPLIVKLLQEVGADQ